MAITAAVCNLARAKYNRRVAGHFLEARGNDLEWRLLNLKQRSTQLSVTMHETSSAKELVAGFLEDCFLMPRAKLTALTAEARRQATLILLYICVKGLPVRGAHVQTRVADCISCISAVARLTTANDLLLWGITPLVWPLFVAGASALQDEHRLQVLQVFEQLLTTKFLGVRSL